MSDNNNMFGNGGPDMSGGYANAGPTGSAENPYGADPGFQQPYGYGMHMGGMPPQYGQVPPPPPYGGHGFYAPPPPPPQFNPYGGFPPPPPGAETSAAQQGLQQALDQMADEKGLGFLKGLVDFNDGDFWKGALVGAAAVLLITNDDLRDSLVDNMAKAADSLKEGLGGLAPEFAEKGEPDTPASQPVETENPVSNDRHEEDRT